MPSVVVSIIIASINGYALSFWKYKGAEFFFTLLVFGAFVPYQVVIYPIIIGMSKVHLFGTLAGHHHRAYDLRHAAADHPVPQLLLVAADRDLQGGAHRRRRVLADLLR